MKPKPFWFTDAMVMVYHIDKLTLLGVREIFGSENNTVILSHVQISVFVIYVNIVRWK